MRADTETGSQEWREARREMGCATEPQQSRTATGGWTNLFLCVCSATHENVRVRREQRCRPRMRRCSAIRRLAAPTSSSCRLWVRRASTSPSTLPGSHRTKTTNWAPSGTLVSSPFPNVVPFSFYELHSLPLFLATPVRQPINAEFFTSFRFQIRRGNGGQGADGFAFVLQVRTPAP
jgi:hypothetical protein